MRKTLALIILIIALTATAAFAGWSEPRLVSPPGGCDAPQILAIRDTLHIVYETTRYYDKIVYQRSTDGGLTWSAQHILSDRLYETLFPKIIARGDRLMALWKKGLTGYYRNTIAFSVSTNNGITWSTPGVVINPGCPDNLYFAASVGNGLNINVVNRTFVDSDLIFYSIRSTNFGQTWTDPQEIFGCTEAGLPDQTSYGNSIHLTWQGRFNLNEPWDIYYCRSTDGGQTWSPNTMLSTMDNHGALSPAICVSDSDKVNVSWMDGKYSPYLVTGDILMRHSGDSGQDWESENQVSFNHFALGASDIVSEGDTINIVWEDAIMGLANRSIYYVKSTDDGATWSEPYWIDGTFDDSSNPALAVSNGKVYCIWTDGRPIPDTNIIGGVYISRWDPEPSGIKNVNNNNVPDEINLSAYPNPFNSTTVINYTNMKGGDIEIFNSNGQLVTILGIELSNEGQIKWDARDAMGNRVSSGIYFARARASQHTLSLKLMYLK